MVGEGVESYFVALPYIVKKLRAEGRFIISLSLRYFPIIRKNNVFVVVVDPTNSPPSPPAASAAAASSEGAAVAA